MAKLYIRIISLITTVSTLLSYLLLPPEVSCFAGGVPVALDHHGEAGVERDGLSVEAPIRRYYVSAMSLQYRMYWLQ